MLTERLPHILIVEDRKLWIDYLKMFMSTKQVHFDFTWVNSGEDAIALLSRGKKFDGVLMNIEMGGINGIEATMILRKMGNRLPIIAWTSHSRAYKEWECLEAGMDFFIEKDPKTYVEDIVEGFENCGVILS